MTIWSNQGESLYVKELSEKVRSAINDISGQFNEEFYAPLVITKGMDELPGVLIRPEMSYRIYELLNDRITPYFFRFAIVMGNIDLGGTSVNFSYSVLIGYLIRIALNAID